MRLAWVQGNFASAAPSLHRFSGMLGVAVTLLLRLLRPPAVSVRTAGLTGKSMESLMFLTRMELLLLLPTMMQRTLQVEVPMACPQDQIVSLVKAVER